MTVPGIYTHVTKNPSGTQTIELNETNEQGIGIEKIVKTPFEITLYDTYPDTVHSYDYYAAILDADGNLLSSGSGGSTNTVAINGADVSTVDIFICDYMQWMDELKGQYGRRREEIKIWRMDGHSKIF